MPLMDNPVVKPDHVVIYPAEVIWITPDPEFENVWNNAEIVDDDWIADYTIDYNLKRTSLRATKENKKEFEFAFH